MKHVIISGRAGSGKTARANQRYAEFTAQGLHVLLDDAGGMRNSLPERRMTAADVLITCRVTSGPLSETIDN